MLSKRTKPRHGKNNHKTPDTAKRQSLGFLVVGILLLSIVLVYRITQAVRLSFHTNVQNITATTEDKKPSIQAISLPKYKVLLNIVESDIIDGVWQINEIMANHLANSSNPGEQGNIVIYGHNSQTVFGPVRWMEVGDRINLTTADNQQHEYIVSQVIETTPDDIQWVLPKQTETLTIYTCSGFLNSQRHLLIAKPIDN